MRSALLGLCFAVSSVFAQEVHLVQVASGLGPLTDIQDPADGSGRLFFVAQDGTIRIFRNGALLSPSFLNIRSRISFSGERGLLGLAFPPGFAQKQRFYVDYTDVNGDTVIAMYRVSSNPDVADLGSETVLMHIAQPFANHNGGQVRFGPDGYLYIAMGDGGSGGDPLRNGQNLGSLLGKILRIDPEIYADSYPGTYRLPPGNPFTSTAGAKPEIWAYGLRNPWRFSFDRANGDLWIGDVGQSAYEEVDYQPASSKGGENYGWNIMEGKHCYDASSCVTLGMVPPISEYTHADGCSITGGFVYRGRLSPGLRGIYFYGDYCSGKIWGIDRQGNRLLLSSGLNITTFGEDSAGELYVGDPNRGFAYRIEGSRAPRFSAADVQNAASFAAGLTPGSLATVFASGVLDDPGIVSATTIPLPLALSGVSITINGVSAPILAIANTSGKEQVNFQVPFEIAGQSNVSMKATRDGSSSTITVPVVPIQPGVFTKDGSEGIVVRLPEYQLISADLPLERGKFAYLYAEGLGPVSNTPVTGSGAPGTPFALVQADVQLTIGGVPCDVLFAALSPGLVGVYQVNFRIAADAPTGTEDLVVTAGGVASPPVKVFVR